MCAEETLEHDDEKLDHRNVFRGDDCGGICGCGCSQHGGKGDAIPPWTAVDATSTKLYSLTDTTKDYVKNLSQDVTIYVLSSEKSADSTLAETLQRYEDLSNI